MFEVILWIVLALLAVGIVWAVYGIVWSIWNRRFVPLVISLVGIAGMVASFFLLVYMTKGASSAGDYLIDTPFFYQLAEALKYCGPLFVVSLIAAGAGGWASLGKKKPREPEEQTPEPTFEIPDHRE